MSATIDRDVTVAPNVPGKKGINLRERAASLGGMVWVLVILVITAVILNPRFLNPREPGQHPDPERSGWHHRRRDDVHHHRRRVRSFGGRRTGNRWSFLRDSVPHDARGAGDTHHLGDRVPSRPDQRPPHHESEGQCVHRNSCDCLIIQRPDLAVHQLQTSPHGRRRLRLSLGPGLPGSPAFCLAARDPRRSRMVRSFQDCVWPGGNLRDRRQ